MSQSPQDDRENDLFADYKRGWDALGTMLRNGKSFSGRERNCCFLNTGHGRFANVSAVTGLDLKDDGRAVAIVDWDNDGDSDVWISNRTAPAVRFFRNTLEVKNHFLALRLRGTNSNRDAIGARVEVVVSVDGSNRKHLRTLTAGDGFRSQSTKELLFGLGLADGVESVFVHWPSGKVQQFRNFKLNRHYLLVEGEQNAMPVDLRSPGQITLHPSRPEKQNSPTAVRTVLTSRISLNALTYRQMDGQEATLDNIGQPMLINLWSSNCLACVKELTRWAAQADRINAVGLKVLLLNVEEIDGPDAEVRESAKQFAEQRGLKFDIGMATRRSLQAIENVTDKVFDRVEPLPLPTSLLIDSVGHVLVIYKGDAEIDQLIDDLELSNASTAELQAAGSPFKGRWIVRPQTKQPNAFTKFIGNPGYILWLLAIGYAAVFLVVGRLRRKVSKNTTE